MKKTFTKFEIATIKKMASVVSKNVKAKNKILAKMEALQEELNQQQAIIDGFQSPIKQLTGGYTTEDLVEEEVVHTGKINEKTGKEVITTHFVLKYPDTVIPPTEDAEEVNESLSNEPLTNGEVSDDETPTEECNVAEEIIPTTSTDDEEKLPWS